MKSYPELPESLLEVEEESLSRWREEDLFRQTLDATEEGEPFVFYEGPPTANGRPGLHHIISRAIKDLICRYHTMNGRSVTRIAGWDTHGLPVEIEAQKAHGIEHKFEIEERGIAWFNQACKDSVFTYKDEWERVSERIGYWLDYSRPYVTFHTDYIESVWWILSQLAERGLLYRGHKVVPWCPKDETVLSSHELAQGYKDIEDPSLYVTMELLDGSDRKLLVWTTTPWTLVSNVGLAVHPELAYVEVEHEGDRIVVARARVEALFGEEARIVGSVVPSELIGARYRRPLDLIAESAMPPGDPWKIVEGDFVTDTDGSGIVHMAPAYGADDAKLGREHDLPVLTPVRDDGTFDEALPIIGGLFFKDADDPLVEELRRRGVLFDFGRETHSYPHCWRCGTPLIYMARDSWFASTSGLKDRMLAHNAEIGWFPPEVGEGRFGEWLANNVDWALSRDRYWGTPLPVWISDADPSVVEWIGSLDELSEKVGGLPEDFDPHRPFIDELTWPCPKTGGTMRRSPEVLDVWFDSGAMPFAQWHYPFENQDEFERHFPADFICEGLDQTRGWFYSLLAISTMLDRGTSYRNVIVNGLVLDAEGQKMSKSRGNTVDPWQALEEYGADALRWYLITVSNPWLPKRYDPEGVREAARKFFDTLFNTYRFFALYANVEEWEPSEADPSVEDRPLIDRWLASRLNSLVRDVRTELDGYQVTHAYRLVTEFLNDDLSNWYVRRCRPRFWGNADDVDGRAAFRTLHDALSTVSALVAPVTPFAADWLHRGLTGESAHLTAFPTPDEDAIDEELEREMDAVRVLSTLGRAARDEVRIRVRQPLDTLRAVLPGAGAVRPEVLALLKDELNVKRVEFLGSGEGLVNLVARPDYRALGPRFQKRTEVAATAIRALPEQRLAAYRDGDVVEISVEGETFDLQPGDLEVVEESSGDWVVRSGEGHTVALDPTVTPELKAEGIARELVNRIQRLRKDSGLEITDRIRLAIGGADEVEQAADSFEPFIAGETLASSFAIGTPEEQEGWLAVRDVELDELGAVIAIDRAAG